MGGGEEWRFRERGERKGRVGEKRWRDGRAREEEGEGKEYQVLQQCGWYWTLNMNGPKAFTHW